MIDFSRATFLIGRMHFVRLVTSRRALFCIGLAFVPALAALAMASGARRAGPAVIAALISWRFLLQVIVPLVALIAGSGVVAEEIEDRTITYVFTRPIPRPALLFGRLGSTLVFLVLLFAPATYLLFQAAARAQGTGGPVMPNLSEPVYLAVLCGVVVYTALFAAFGAFFRHPMIVGLGYTFAIEGFLSNLPGKNQSLTIQYYLRSLIAERGSDALRRIDGFRASVFESGTTALVILGSILALVLVLGAWRLATKEFELTS